LLNNSPLLKTYVYRHSNGDVSVMVFNATFNNISVISWRSVLLVEQTAHSEVYSIQHYVIQFVSDLRQVCGFIRVLQFPPPLKLATMI
jgi:hypothetical protein